MTITTPPVHNYATNYHIKCLVLSIFVFIFDMRNRYVKTNEML